MNNNTQVACRRMAEAIWIIIEDADAGDNAIDSITLAIRDHTVVPEMVELISCLGEHGDTFLNFRRRAQKLLVKAKGTG